MTEEERIDKWVKSGLLDGMGQSRKSGDPVSNNLIQQAKRGGMINKDDVDYIFPVIKEEDE